MLQTKLPTVESTPSRRALHFTLLSTQVLQAHVFCYGMTKNKNNSDMRSKKRICRQVWNKNQNKYLSKFG